MIRYDTTAGGVMVQVHMSEPTDAEWTMMLDHLLAHKETLTAVLAIAQGESGPSSKQRAQLAEVVKHLPSHQRFALVTNSRIARGVLTAINWLTKKDDLSRAFPLTGLDDAMTFLGIEEQQKAEVRSLIFKLGGFTAPPRSALL